jgi:hypothetical protein
MVRSGKRAVASGAGPRLGVLLAVASAVGCGASSGQTAIDVTATVEASLALDAIVLTASTPGKPNLVVNLGAQTPVRVTITPSGIADGGLVAVELSGLKNGATIVRDLALIGLQAGKRVSVALELTLACENVLSCPDDETCRGGGCIPISISGAGGAAASGGNSGAGGAGGGAGAGGNATNGGSGGSAGAGTGGTPGGGGYGGRGGSVGTGGVMGGGGRVGTGGVIGTGGAGTGGAGTGGTPPPPDGGADAPDAACVPAAAENCFNGVDDDCDGLADCADPSCTSVGVCAPTDGAFSLGLTVASDSPCPTGYQAGSPTLIYQGVAGDKSCDGCSCSVTSHCSTTLRAYPSTTACTGTPAVLASLDETSKCVPLAAGHSGLPSVDAFAYTASCSSGGAATPSAWSWSTTMKFCPADPPGGGCKTGFACVHKTTANYCELGSGSCSTGFTDLAGGTWYTSATDGRTCGSCDCQITAAGNCAGSRVLEHPDGECAVANPSSFVLLQGDRCDGFGETSGFTTADLNVSYSAATCAGTSAMSGAVTPSGTRRVCCQ